MTQPIFVATAVLDGVGDVDIQLFDKGDGHIRMLVSAGPGDVVLNDTTDGSLLHAYENLDDCTHHFGPCLFSGNRKLQNLTFAFGAKTESESFSRYLFERFVGPDSNNWMCPRKCGILQKEGGFVHRYQSRWFLYHRNNWLSYWKSPRESLPLGIIDWRSVCRVGIPGEVLSSAGDFEIENVRGTNGKRVHHLRAKSSEARDRWVSVLLDGKTEAPVDTAAPATETPVAVAPPTGKPFIALEPADKGKWKPIFGVPLDMLLEIEERVGSLPLLVASMVDYLAPRASQVTNDLFTTPGAAAAVLSVKSALEQGQDPVDILEECGDVHVAATVLKKFLLELPDPVCSYDLLGEFVAAMSAEKPAEELHTLVESLSPSHQTLLRSIIAFLKLLSQHQDINNLTSQVLAESLGTTLVRELCVYPGQEASSEAAVAAVVCMMEESDKVFVDPPLLKGPVFKNLTWKLLLVGRLLRVTPEDVERKLAILTEINTLKEKLAGLEADFKSKAGGGRPDQEEALGTQMTKHMERVQQRLAELQGAFYNMEVPCGPPNVAFLDDTVAPKLLREVSDHIELLKQEEISMRTVFRKGSKASDRPTVGVRDLPKMLREVGAAVGMGDALLDSEDMFHELRFLVTGEDTDGEGKYTLPEFLDVVGKWMEMRGLFRSLDKYKSGYIYAEDILKAMRDFGALWGYRPTIFHFVQLLHEFDIDARHGITWEEFRMLMHRWIEEKKKSFDIGKDTTKVEVVSSSEVLVDQLKKELKGLFLKFENVGGGIDILCLGGLFEEVCHAFELGGTLSDLFRLLRVMETGGVVSWEMFVGVMSKWIIMKQLFGNYSKDGGNTIRAKDVEPALHDLRTVWGCFDPRYGAEDVATLAKEVAASVDLGYLTFEEFMSAMRYQVALKSIFELNDTAGVGALTLEGTLSALKAAEDYCGQFPAYTTTAKSLMANAHLDEEIAMTWPEFLGISNIAIGDEFDGSS